MYTAWEDSDRLSDVHDNGPNYMYALIYDYEEYVSKFGYISISVFLHGWSCIPRSLFTFLSSGDIVYDPQGRRYRIIGSPYQSSDDETTVFIEAAHIREDNAISSTTEILSSGDIYFEPFVHYDFQWKKQQLKESEEKPCPILITKKSQLQS